jgi:hypothetical protein
MFSFDESLRYIFINRSLSSKLYFEFAPIITVKVIYKQRRDTNVIQVNYNKSDFQ